MQCAKRLIFTFLFILTTAQPSAGWLIYHKPEYKGKVIDAETKEPIEGAVVVVAYKKYTIGVAGSHTTVINVKESLTDKEGMFRFSAYTTIINPISGDDNASFLIYKPGYGNFPDGPIAPSYLTAESIEKFFSNGIGFKGELKGVEWRASNIVKVVFGIVELPRLVTRDERLNAIPSSPIDAVDETSQQLPILFKMINDENRRLGLQSKLNWQRRGNHRGRCLLVC